MSCISYVFTPSLESVRPVKHNIFYQYDEYEGRVNIDRKPDGSIEEVYITNIFGQSVCRIDKKRFKDFVEYENKLVQFLGRRSFRSNSRVTPHTP